MTKKLQVASVIAGVLSISVHADSASRLSDRVDAISEKNINGHWQGKVAPASVERGPFFSVDFLYWQAKEDGLEYAQKDTFDSRGNPFLVNSKIQDLDFHWKPGVKLAFGYIFPRDQWDLSLSWTYLHSKAHNSTSTSDPALEATNLRPSWLPVLLGSISDHASAHWRMNYNVLDLGIGRHFFIGKRLSFRPHADLKAIWIYQNYDVNYHGGFQFIDVGVFSTLFKNTKMSAKNDFAAVGIALGADTEWHLSQGWSLLANVSGTLAYGQFKVKERFDGGFLTPSGGEIIINDEVAKVKNTFWRLRPSFETELGLQWQTFYHREKYRVALAATYNFVYWASQNELMNSIVSRDSVPLGLNINNINANVVNVRQQGNLQMQGVKLELRLDF